MTFWWRDALWLLCVLPAVAATYFLLLKRRKRNALQYASIAFISAALTSSHRLRRHVPPLLLFLAMTFAVLAIARPAAVFTLPAEQRTVVLAIDVSFSMAGNDVLPSRLEAAQAAAKAFIRDQPRDVRIAIVAFAGEADLVQTPTADRGEAMAAVDRLKLNYNTAIGSGVLAALLTIFPDMDIGGDFDIFGFGRSPVLPRRFSRNQPPKVEKEHFTAVPPASYASAAIILLTDGRGTLGISPSKAAQMAAERGIRVFTVGFGSPAGADIDMDGESVHVKFDEETLREIAQVTHAEYFSAATANELVNVYRHLRGRVVLERKEREVTALFSALAAVLMIAAGATSLAWGARFA